MHLTRYELIRATDKQLQAIGIQRKNSHGWLKRALSTAFSSGQVTAFRAADTRLKNRELPPGIARDREVNFGRPRLAKSSIGTNVIASRFLAGESVEYLATDYGINASEVESALRHEFKQPTVEESPEDYANRIFEKDRLEFTD